MLQVLLIKTQMINFSANLEKNNFSIRRKIELGSGIGSRIEAELELEN